MKRPPLDTLAADIADDRSVDWEGLQGASQADGLVREFRIIAAIGSERQGPSVVDRPAASRILRLAEGLLSAAVVAAIGMLVVAGFAILTAPTFRVGPRAFLALTLGSLGLALIRLGRVDHATRILGVLFVLIASTFTSAYLVRASEGWLAPLARLLLHGAPGSLIALALWMFAWVFPSPPRSSRAQAVGRFAIGVTGALGFLFIATSLGRAFVVAGQDPLMRDGLLAAGRVLPSRAFWPVVAISGSLALPYLFWKSAAGTVEDRARTGFVGLALSAGIGPIVLAILLLPLWPAMSRPNANGLLSAAMYLSVGSLVPATLYAVLVKKVFDVRVAIRRAAQHALVRGAVTVGIAALLAYVVITLWVSRERSLALLMSEQAGLMSLTAVGLLALTFRVQLLRAVDSWFERGDADYSEVMTRFAGKLAGQRNIRDLCTMLEEELRVTLRTSNARVVVLNDERSAYVNLDGAVPPLRTSSAIAVMLIQSRHELRLGGAEPDPMVRFVPDEERRWLASAAAVWVFPLVDSSDDLIGLICLGDEPGVPYSRRDRILVSALGDQVALRIENLSLRRWPADAYREPDRASGRHVDWKNERAMRCSTCNAVMPADAVSCVCGSRLEPASIPHVLNGKFRVERVLGQGGMSVVYLAVDSVLHRKVAIKTLPTATPLHVARLEREARAMASVLHPNLAMIYGAEHWRDVPLLVVEFLDGGTLLDGLRAGPMPVDDVIGLGIELADALDLMHAGGLLHRDIKPSNIGYTSKGLPKLLDFGLAAMLDRAHDEESGGGRPATLPTDGAALSAFLSQASPAATRTLTHQLVGTPLYLSPEALAGREPEPSFDLWSLAMVLYQAIAGRHPFDGFPAVEAMRRTRSVRLPDVRDFRQDCPPAVAAFLNDALSLSIERRPPTAAVFRAALQALRQGIASEAAHSHRSLY